MTETLSRVRVVLCATSHPGNIGAAARALHTMGLRRLVLVAPRSFPHPDAEARATGAAALLAAAEVVATLDEALAGCALSIGFSARPREFAGAVLSVRQAAAEAIAHADQASKGCSSLDRAGQAGACDVALVFGNETSGLSNEELARCGLVATIPANPAYSSLNLAAAVQIAAYEVRVAALGDGVWRAPRFPAASDDEIERLHTHTARTLAAIGFLDPRRPRRLMPRLRRLFGRARLEKEEVNILRGILAEIDRLHERPHGKP